MPTLVKFASGTDIKLTEDFDKVNSQLSSEGSGLFNRERGQRVVVYRDNVLYIEDLEGVSPKAAGFA